MGVDGVDGANPGADDPTDRGPTDDPATGDADGARPQDWFEEFTFDDDFVSSAQCREASADERFVPVIDDESEDHYWEHEPDLEAGSASRFGPWEFDRYEDWEDEYADGIFGCHFDDQQAGCFPAMDEVRKPQSDDAPAWADLELDENWLDSDGAPNWPSHEWDTSWDDETPEAWWNVQDYVPTCDICGFVLRRCICYPSRFALELDEYLEDRAWATYRRMLRRMSRAERRAAAINAAAAADAALFASDLGDYFFTDEFAGEFADEGSTGEPTDPDGNSVDRQYFNDRPDSLHNPQPPRRRRARTGVTVVSAVVVIAVIAAYAASQLVAGFALGRANKVANATMGNEDPRPSITDTPDSSVNVLGEGEQPPRPAVSRTTRVAPAPVIPSPGGAHKFLMTQTGSTKPVTYDPCREIHYVTSGLASAPAGAKELIADALAQVSKLTGLVFVDDGPTDERPVDQRAAYQPDRYGKRWAPVLIAWSDAAESPTLAESAAAPTSSDGTGGGGTTGGLDVLGYSGSTAIVTTPSGSTNKVTTYVTGMVVLDAPDFVSLLSLNGGKVFATATVMHEVGHLLGLDHVDDSTELMYPSLQPDVTEFGPGDRDGLAALGRGRCMPDL